MNFRISAVCLAAAVAVSGCAVPKRGGADGQAGGQDVAQVCNPALIGISAGLICAAVAKGNDRVRAAAACAAVAVTACYLANSYKAEQVRTAKQVEDEYLQRNRQLPEKATVTTYRSEVNPRGAVSKGQQVTLASTIIAVPGRSDSTVRVEEELAIIDNKGEAWGKPVRKTANSANQAGEFKTSFTIPISDGWSQGVYTLRRTLYVNGAVAKRDDSDARFQVVQGPAGHGIEMLASASR